jgi:hypothetical protein
VENMPLLGSIKEPKFRRYSEFGLFSLARICGRISLERPYKSLEADGTLVLNGDIVLTSWPGRGDGEQIR